MRFGAFGVALLSAVCLPLTLHAYPNDLDLSGLVQWEGNCGQSGKNPDGSACTPRRDAQGRVVPDQRGFDGLVEEMAVLMAPRDVGLARTPGQAGFDVGVEASLHKFNNQNDYWARTMEKSARKNGDAVFPQLGTLQLWVKKGLPYSLEIMGGATYLIESRYVGIGGMGKWTLNEGFFWFPDVALTAGANRILCMGLPSSPVQANSADTTNGTALNTCPSDLNMFTATVGAVVSKSFSLLGMFNISPYAGWQKIFVHAFSPRLRVDERRNDQDLPADSFRFRDYKMWGDFVGQDCGEQDVTPESCVLDRSGSTAVPQLARLFTHRNKLYAGLKIQFYILQIMAQGELTHVRGTEWNLSSPRFTPESLRLAGVTTPDFQLAGTVRLGFYF